MEFKLAYFNLHIVQVSEEEKGQKILALALKNETE